MTGHEYAQAVALAVEGRELLIGGSIHTVWEGQTFPHLPGQVHLEVGPHSHKTVDVVLHVVSVTPHGDQP